MITLKNIDQYRLMHESPELFRGFTGMRHIEAIRELVEKTGSVTVLDYGSGKGEQYRKYRMHEQIGIPLPRLYDPGIPKISKIPNGTFDGVICTDVLEHLEKKDIEVALAQIFIKAERFVFLSICIRGATKTLPDGRNCHLTVMPPEWWDRVIQRTSSKYPAVRAVVVYTV